MKTRLEFLLAILLTSCLGQDGRGMDAKSVGKDNFVQSGSSNGSVNTTSGARTQTDRGDASAGANSVQPLRRKKDLDDRWLHTEGNRILRSDGSVFMGKGANIFDTKHCGSGLGVDGVKRNIDELVDNWGADFFRLCLARVTTGLGARNDNYLRSVIEIVEHIGRKRGVYVLVTTWTEPTVSERGLPTDATILYWRKLTRRLAKYPFVMFGVSNEPEGRGDTAEFRAETWKAMNRIVQAVREEEVKVKSPEHLIAVQGTSGYSKYLQYYVDHPITAFEGRNIVYETHAYAGKDKFDMLVGNPAKSIPVIIGEFGPDPDFEAWMPYQDQIDLMEYAERRQVPFAAWAFHTGCGIPMLLDSSSFAPTKFGQAVKENLLYGVSNIQSADVSSRNLVGDVSNSITFTLQLKPSASDVVSVKLDLTAVGLGQNVSMTSKGSGAYSLTVKIPAMLAEGSKKIFFKTMDRNGGEKIKEDKLLVSYPAAETYKLFADDVDLINWNWAAVVGNESRIVKDTSSGDAFDPGGSIRVSSNFTSGTGYLGIVLKSQKKLNVKKYKSVQVSYKASGSMPHPEKTKLKLLGGSNKSSAKIVIKTPTSRYQTVTIPISRFTGIDFTNIYGVGIDMAGPGLESITFWIDGIKFLVQ